MSFPSPDTLHPVARSDGDLHRGTVFLAPAVAHHPRIEVGDYTYASSHSVPSDWAAALAPYLYPFSPERLTIGKFCQIADGVRIITSSANHRYDGFSSFPFGIFDGGLLGAPSMPDPGPDTIVGNDVWIGQGVTVLPGAQIGDGVIIGAGSVVGGKIADYSVVAGNPAQIRRKRFDDRTIEALVDLAWWDWPIDHIRRHEAEIVGGDIAALIEVAPGA